MTAATSEKMEETGRARKDEEEDDVLLSRTKEAVLVTIPSNAKVECTDGPCGKSTHVIVSPVGYKVTHYAVQDMSLPDNSTRLAPAGNVASVTEQQNQAQLHQGRRGQNDTVPRFEVYPGVSAGYGLCIGRCQHIPVCR